MDPITEVIAYRERASSARSLASILASTDAPAADVRHCAAIARLADALADHAENEAVAELLEELG